MREFLAITKALADANRSRILLFLGDDELCVCQIIRMLGRAPSTVSQHLAVLVRAGLIEQRKDGRIVYCRVARGGSREVRAAVRFTRDCLGRTPKALQDLRRLEAVVKMDLADLCRRYKPAVSAAKPARSSRRVRGR